MIYEETSFGEYHITVEKKRAIVNFIRTKPNKRFKLSEILKKHGLKKIGIYQIQCQFYYFTTKEKVELNLYSNWLHRTFLLMAGSPLTETTFKDVMHRRKGAQEKLPEGAEFKYAYSKITFRLK